MMKIKSFFFFVLSFSLIFILFNLKIVSVFAANPHFELSPSSGDISDISTGGTRIDILIDTGAYQIRTAKVVLNYDSNRLEVLSVQNGGFLDEVSDNIYNSQGRLVLNANTSFSDFLAGRSGIGTLATVRFGAKGLFDSSNVEFDCTPGKSIDSGINTIFIMDVIDCSSNVSGAYSGGGGFPSPSPSQSPGISPSPSYQPLPSPSPSPRISPSPSPWTSPSPSPRISPSPSPVANTNMTIVVKLSGVPANNNDMNLPVDHRQQDIRTVLEDMQGLFYYFGDGNITYTYNTVSQTFDTEIIFQINDLPSGQYNFLLKGPSHRQIKFCQQNQSKDHICTRVEAINITAGQNYNMTFSGHPLEFGDINWSGSAGVEDYSILIGCRDLDSRKGDISYTQGCFLADGNLDGVVDITDVDLFYLTISSKPDDE